MLLGWVAPDVGEIHVASDKCRLGLTSACRNLFIACIGHADVTRELDLMTKFRERTNRRARQVGIEEEAHAGLDGGQWVKRFLFGQFGNELKSSANVLS